MFDIRKVWNVSAAFSSGIMIVLNYLINGIRMDFSFFLLGNRPAERSNFEAFSLSYNTRVCGIDKNSNIFTGKSPSESILFQSCSCFFGDPGGEVGK